MARNYGISRATGAAPKVTRLSGTGKRGVQAKLSPHHFAGGEVMGAEPKRERSRVAEDETQAAGWIKERRCGTGKVRSVDCLSHVAVFSK